MQHFAGLLGAPVWSGRGTITVTVIKFAFLFPGSQLMHSEDLQEDCAFITDILLMFVY